MNKVSRRKLKGSVLGFSLMLLSLFLLSGITVVSVAILERKASFTAQKSIIAFQAADSAGERVLNRIYMHNTFSADCPTCSLAGTPLNNVMPDQDLNELANNLYRVVDASTACGDASSQIYGMNDPTQSPAYTFQVVFFDNTGARIGCLDQTWRDKVVRFRTEGTYQRTSRVIEIGVRPRT